MSKTTRQKGAQKRATALDNYSLGGERENRGGGSKRRGKECEACERGMAGAHLQVGRNTPNKFEGWKASKTLQHGLTKEAEKVIVGSKSFHLEKKENYHPNEVKKNPSRKERMGMTAHKEWGGKRQPQRL